jgi:peptidoglycan/LPS O-acetylase OafA/YrhL
MISDVPPLGKDRVVLDTPENSVGDAPRLRATAQASTTNLAFLDGMRGIAAAYVMVGHARWLLWEGYSEGYLRHPERYSLGGKALVYAGSAFRWGHEAVLFFFVLSGFVIHLRYARRLQDGGDPRFDLGPYLYRRARRIYPPLIAALLITWGLDAFGAWLHLATADGTTLYPGMNVNIGRDHSLTTALRNLLCIMFPVFGSDGPLWSLNFEWYFYLFYPAFYLVTRRSWVAATCLMVALSALGFAPIWPASLFWLRGVCAMMIVWWFGALLADCFVGRLRIHFASLVPALAAFLVLPFLHLGPTSRDLVVGIGVAGFVAACFVLKERGASLAPLVRLGPLGEMSYTLYVVHFPILVLCSGLLMRASGGTLPMHFGWVVVAIALCLTAAWALHFLVERPFTSRRPGKTRA